MIANQNRLTGWKSILRDCFVLAAAAIVLLAGLSQVRAEMRATWMLPIPPTRMKHGLTVELDLASVQGNGYRTVRVKVSNTPKAINMPVAATADRKLRVVLRPYQGWGQVSAVEQEITIPATKTSAEATLAVFEAGDVYTYQIEVYEKGRKLDDVSTQFSGLFSGRNGNEEILPAVLLLDSDIPGPNLRGTTVPRNTTANPTYNIPDYRNLVDSVPLSTTGGGVPLPPLGTPAAIPDSYLVALAGQYDKFALKNPSELSRRWIELSCYDVAVISMDDLAQMAAQKREALVEWLHTGPTLIVYGVGDDYQRLAELEKLLALSPLPGHEQRPQRGWVVAAEADRYTTRDYNTYNNVYGRTYATPAMAQNMPAPQQPIVSGNSGTPLFYSRGAKFGHVIAVGSKDLFPGAASDWRWILNAIPSNREQWVVRHGISHQSRNREFWNWHIPGVGAAPVFGFLALSTIFALVIGPVNYLILGRLQRLYFLLVTVPAGAALVTLGLFAYALVSDGLGVRARIRSLSLLDQQYGRTVNWSRQSYFASLVPSKGLVYPEDAAVIPIIHQPESRYNMRSSSRGYVKWDGDQQQLASGYLASRTLTQLLVLRATETKARLDVLESTTGKPPKVGNELGTAIHTLVLRTRKGEYFVAEKGLAVGQSLTLEPISTEKARQAISKAIQKHQPQFPSGYDPDIDESRSFWGGRWWGGTSVTAMMNSSLLESNLRELTVANALQPGEYLAIVDRPAEVPLGVATAEEADSFHVIVGRW